MNWLRSRLGGLPAGYPTRECSGCAGYAHALDVEADRYARLRDVLDDVRVHRDRLHAQVDRVIRRNMQLRAEAADARTEAAALRREVDELRDQVSQDS